MSSDRARVSYDPTRQYRSVVAQQGRVTLEADVNEAQEIAGEILRLETIDIVGASGTPDDGYKVAAAAGGQRDFAVGPGTMYVGGERVTWPANVTYATQPEWLDRSGDPLWSDPPQAATATEFVYLLLREQEVSAVEDTALREVALGGPDTAQRKRLVQRIVRMPVSANSCASALQEAQAAWSAAGANFNSDTMTLTSPAKLQVGLVNPPTPATVCEPQAQGGYIGADNQLIRVQIASCSADKKGGTFVWGYNNASFLHRAKLVQSGLQSIVELLTTPVDTYHTPRANHPVEVLRCAVALSKDPAIDPLNRDYVAAHCGQFVTPTDEYQAGSRQLLLPATIADTGGTPLFLRLWEEELQFTSGQPVTLTGTGLQVTIDLNNSGGSFTVGQFWTFAARPNTPAEVYPHRYLFEPQPPEGPRLWTCPLATIGWAQQIFSLIEDCRNPFDNLVELTRRHEGTCICSIVAGPTDNLQNLIDTIPAGADAQICLQIGSFALPSTVTIANKGHILLHGSGRGTKLAVAKGECVLQVSSCASITIRDCAFEGATAGDGNVGLGGLNGAVTIRDCPSSEVFAVTLSCAPAMKRSASGLSIYNAKGPGTRAVVDNCVVGAGHLQVGILVVNAETAHILNNKVQAAGSLPPGASRLLRRRVTKLLLSQLENVAPPTPGAGTGKPKPPATPSGRTITVTVAGNELRFQTDPASGLKTDDWQRFVTAAKPPEKMAPQSARRWLLKAVDMAVAQAAGEATPRSRINRAIKDLLTGIAVTASQGIVVAGESIGDLAIDGNIVRQALQGIHVGISTEKMTTPLFAEHVNVFRNAVTVAAPVGDGARHGVFVGNCHSVHVADNRIDAAGISPATERMLPEGIRIFGFLGSFAIVRANHISGLRIGIRFNPLGEPIPQRPQWLVTDNLAESAQQVVATPNATIRSRIRGVDDNYA